MPVDNSQSEPLRGTNSEHHGNAKGKRPLPSVDDFVPPDGGWGWVVCFCSMLANGTVFGVINTFGIIYVVMRDTYAKDDPNVSFKTSFVGSVCTGVTFIMCIFSSILCDRVGIRPTAFIGAVIGCAGLGASAFVNQLELLYLTYGVLLGVGAALTYCPSMVILGHYFKRHLGLVNGLNAFGSALFTILLSIVMPIMLEALAIKYTFLVLGGLYFILALCTLTWRPLFQRETDVAALTLSTESVYEHCHDCCTFTKKFLNVRIFRSRAYNIWCLSLAVSLLGYFIPFVHLVKYTKDRFPDANGPILITCLQITSGVGRLVFGKVADLPFVNRVYLQQAAFFGMGVVTMCVPLSASFGGLIAIALLFGLCDGIFVCLIGPIAFDIVGPREASQAIGFLFGFFALPFSLGPPIGGLMYDSMGSYDIAFYFAGATPVLGAIIMFFIPRIKQQYPAVTEVEHFASMSVLSLNERHPADKYKPHSYTDNGPSKTELQIVRVEELMAVKHVDDLDNVSRRSVRFGSTTHIPEPIAHDPMNEHKNGHTPLENNNSKRQSGNQVPTSTSSTNNEEKDEDECSVEGPLLKDTDCLSDKEKNEADV